MRIVDHVASLAAGRAGWRGCNYSKHCSLLSVLTTNVTAPSQRAGTAVPRLQVARLIAGGRSNKDIAAELISQRTAENHVEHILAKLGFTSGAQVAAWAVASQPDGGAPSSPRIQAP